MENVALVFIASNSTQKLAFEILEMKYVLLYVHGVLKPQANKPEITCHLPGHCIEPMIKRVTKEIQNGNVGSICNSNLWCDQTFIEEWLRYITTTEEVNLADVLCPSTCKIDWCYLLNRIFLTFFAKLYVSIENYGIDLAGHDNTFSVLTALIFYGKQRAVLAILNNKFIIEKMKEVTNWNEIMEMGLQIACTKDEFFDVILAFLSHNCNIGSAALIAKMYSHDDYADAILVSKKVCTEVSSCGTSKENDLKDFLSVDRFEATLYEYSDQMIEAFIESEPDKLDLLTGSLRPVLFVLTDILLGQKPSLLPTMIVFVTHCLSEGWMVPVEVRPAFESFEFLEMLSNNGFGQSISNGRTVTFCAEQDDDTERFSRVFTCLKHQKVDIHIKDKKGRNLVLYTLAKRSVKTCLEVLPQLLDSGIDFHATDNKHQNALHYLFKRFLNSEHMKLFEYLIKSTNLSLSDKDDAGRIPLMLLLEYSYADFMKVEFLQRILNDSPRKHVDKNGHNLFHYIANSLTCSYSLFCCWCELLQQEGEDITINEIGFDDHSGKVFDKITFCLENTSAKIFGNFALTVVEKCSDSRAIDLLMVLNEKGADFQSSDDNKRNVLHHLFLRYSYFPNASKCLSCQYTNVRKIFSFLKTSVNLSVRDYLFQKDVNDVTPLMLALKYKPDMICEDIVSLEIPIHVDDKGRGYFHYLVEAQVTSHFEDICSTLLENKVDINSEDLSGASPLYLCACRFNVDRMIIMLKLGATINYQNDKWATVFASSDGYPQDNMIVSALRKAGINDDVYN